jgi:hypothetical protein
MPHNNEKEMNFQIQDTVKVKSGTEDPDFGIDISGWQGWISEIDDDLVCITWDSITLSSFSDEHIFQCEEDGLDWKRMYLSVNEIVKTSPRDSITNLEKKINEIQSKHHWDYLGELGKRVQTILGHIDFEDEIAAFKAWEQYLDDNLFFPFAAKISEPQTQSPLKQGDKIKVMGLMGNEDLYGVIVKFRSGRKVYYLPLCEIEVFHRNSNNYKIVNDYCVWFADR